MITFLVEFGCRRMGEIDNDIYKNSVWRRNSPGTGAWMALDFNHLGPVRV